MNKFLVGLVGLVSVCGFGGVYWTGGAGDGVWGNGANWSGEVVPGAEDCVDVEVAAGATVDISDVYAYTKIRKTGAGTLRLHFGSISNAANSVVELVEGRLEFPRVELPDELKEKMAFWVNPAMAETVHTHEVDGTNFVWRIDDVRGNGLFAYATDDAEQAAWSGVEWGGGNAKTPARTPWLGRDETVAKAPYLEFGSLVRTNALDKGWGGMLMWNTRPDNVQTLVMAALDNRETKWTFWTESDGTELNLHQALAGDTRMGSRDLERGFGKGWMDGTLVHIGLSDEPKSALVMSDGVNKGGALDGDMLMREGPMAVLAMRKNRTAFGLDSFGYYKNSSDPNRERLGGIRMGETMVFTQRLTVAEMELACLAVAQNYRRDLATVVGGALEYSDDGAGGMRVEAPYKGYLPRAAAGAATLEKRGEGTYVVEGGLEAGQTIRVMEGKVTVLGWEKPPYFQLDPSRLETLTLEASGDKMLIPRADDPRRNGKYGYMKPFQYADYRRKPYLGMREIFEGGEAMPVIDFGELQSKNNMEQWGGEMLFSQDATIHSNLQAMAMVRADREYYAADGTPRYQQGLFRMHSSGNFAREWERITGSGRFSNPSLNPPAGQPGGVWRVGNGDFSVDGGAEVKGSSEQAKIADFKFHNITGRWTADFGRCPSTEGIGTSFERRGGVLYGELATWTNKLSDAEMGRVRSYLDVKWFGGTGAYEDAYSCGELEVRKGAKLEIGAAPLNLGTSTAVKLMGGGEVETYRLAVSGEVRIGDEGEAGELKVKGDLTIGDGATVKTGCEGKDGLGCLTVTGKLTLGAGCTLVADALDGKTLAYGEHVLMRAGEIANGDAARWWGSGGTLKGLCAMRVKAGADGKTVVLSVKPRGMLVIVK